MSFLRHLLPLAVACLCAPPAPSQLKDNPLEILQGVDDDQKGNDASSAKEPHERATVPDKSQLDEALKVVKKSFKDDYLLSKPDERKRFAKKLLKQAEKTEEPATRYALLQEAYDIAFKANEPSLALKAANAICKQFEVNAISFLDKTLANLATAAKTPEANADMAEAFLKLADDALRQENYAIAAKAAASSSTAALKTKSTPLQEKAKAKIEEIKQAATK